MKDIREFLKKQINNPFRNIFILPDKKRKILALFFCFLKGDLSFIEFLKSIFPVSFRSIEVSLKRQLVINKNIASYLRNRDFLSSDGYLNLFGNPFYFLNLEDALGSISELIVYDEYNASQIIKDNFTVLDIGANIGVFSIFAANLAKNGFVYAFEPVSTTYEILEKNSSFYKNIKIFKIGIGKEKKETEIFIRSWNSGYATINLEEIERNQKSFDKREKIIILPLDEIIKEEKINKVDFIKVDVEGYELEVLKGAINTLKESKPILAISLHHSKFKQLIHNFINEKLSNLYIIQDSSKNVNDIFLIPLR